MSGRRYIQRGDWPRLKNGLRGRLFGRIRARLLLRIFEFCSHCVQWRERKLDQRGQGLRPATTCTQKTIRAVARGGCIDSEAGKTPLEYEESPLMEAWREWKCN